MCYRLVDACVSHLTSTCLYRVATCSILRGQMSQEQWRLELREGVTGSGDNPLLRLKRRSSFIGDCPLNVSFENWNLSNVQLIIYPNFSKGRRGEAQPSLNKPPLM